MKNAIFPGISRTDYNKIDAINISLLVEGERSMAHLKHAMDNPKESTPAMEKGTATHLAVFEPAEFEKNVAVYDGIRRGKAWDSFYENCAKSLILKPDEFSDVINMRDALRNHPRVREILDSKGTGEMGVVWKDEESGLWCKGLVDRFCSCWGYSLIIDLKSCQDASASGFSKTVHQYNYHVKCAWYKDALECVSKCERRFYWIAIESQQPHGIAIYEPDDDTIQEGRLIYRELLSKYKKCTCTSQWPSYDTEVQSLRIPKYGFRKI